MTGGARTEVPARAPREARLVEPTDRPRPLDSVRVRTALVLLPLFLLIFAQPFKALTDPDYWWHVRTGQYIFQTGTVPMVDIYSYTMPGKPWVAEEWLSELLLYVVSLHVGYVGNVVLFGVIGVLTGLVVYATCRRRGVGEFGAALLMVWASALAEPAFNVRPQVFTAFLLAVCVWLVTKYKQGEARALWPLPVIFALWVNLHGGFIIGLALLGMTAVGEVVARGLRQPAAPLRPLLGVTGLSALASLLNPHGWNELLYPFSYLGPGNAITRYIAEWQSPDFHQPPYLLFAASLLALIALGVWRRPLGPTEAIWALGFAFLSLQSARHVALFAAVVLPLLGARLQTELPALRRSLAAWQKPGLLVAICPLLLIVVASTTLAQATKTGLQTGWEPNPATFPVGAVAYLQSHDLPGRLFDQYDWGGYHIDQVYPRRTVFIDGRIDLYGDAVGKQYDTAINAGPGWRQVLDEYNVRVVLVDRTGPLSAALGDDPSWHRVYQGPVADLFAR